MSTQEKNGQAQTPVTPPSEEAGGYVKWGDVGKKSSGGKSGKGGDRKTVEYLKLVEGVTARIRLVGKPYEFYRHYTTIQATSPGFKQDVAWQAGHEPKKRYAILCLDRNDENKLKVFEAGPLVFESFMTYYEMSKNDPGGVEGPDWVIQMKIPVTMKDGKSFKDKRQTKYTVVRDEKVPFTAEEAAYLKANWIELKEVKKPTDPELIKEMLESAKTRGNNDPVPGSVEWWKERRDRRDSENGKSDSGTSSTRVTSRASEEPEPNPAASSAKSAVVEDDNEASEGYNSLFDEATDSKDSKKPKF